jgi:hypothetical protein
VTGSVFSISGATRACTVPAGPDDPNVKSNAVEVKAAQRAVASNPFPYISTSQLISRNLNPWLERPNINILADCDRVF